MILKLFIIIKMSKCLAMSNNKQCCEPTFHDSNFCKNHIFKTCNYKFDINGMNGVCCELPTSGNYLCDSHLDPIMVADDELEELFPMILDTDYILATEKILTSVINYCITTNTEKQSIYNLNKRMCQAYKDGILKDNCIDIIAFENGDIAKLIAFSFFKITFSKKYTKQIIDLQNEALIRDRQKLVNYINNDCRKI